MNLWTFNFHLKFKDYCFRHPKPAAQHIKSNFKFSFSPEAQI
ncbi:hypothetical protein DGWBC_1583 [Dehalogenimonas sp. WBC-2]|nr:hypothetical protein DGWBC_1583 [Dehalogenimonas sp. WBC-2]